MLSVFQIFKMLIGVMVFIFIITFFLRITDMYSGIGEITGEYETAGLFDKTAVQTYTSGNPSSFPGFQDFEMVAYDAPKLKFSAGQKTMTVPVFMIPDKAEMTLERRCQDYGWFRFCWVFAYPDASGVLFTPIENTEASMNLIKDIVADMPENIVYGYCNGTLKKDGPKGSFLATADSEMTGKTYISCEASLGDKYRLVTVGPGSVEGENIVIKPSTKTAYSVNMLGKIEGMEFHDTSELHIFITGGVDAYRQFDELFRSELKTATKVMLERTILVKQMTQKANRQPCQECAPPFLKACGWTDYEGDVGGESTLYKDFINSLNSLKSSLESDGDYRTGLENTATAYGQLKEEGCE